MNSELVPMTSAMQTDRLRRLLRCYPFIYAKVLTKTAGGRPVYALQLGKGSSKILLVGAHHANEYITSMLIWEMLESYCEALTQNGSFGGVEAAKLYHRAMLYIVPMLNPDGVDLVTGAILPDSAEYQRAKAIAAGYRDIPFPCGWKANLAGVDLNLNYPAGWYMARQIKAEQGFFEPAPRDFVGAHPLDQAESAALVAYTCCVRPDLVLTYHTQGRVIYHTFADKTPPASERLAREFAEKSGYILEQVPAESANAGYKDWFLQRFYRPGFTIEAGLGENPLPLSQLPQMVQENIPLLAHAMMQ